jgi:hypothetical protein
VIGQTIKLLNVNVRENMDIGLINANQFQVRLNNHNLLNEVVLPILELFKPQADA